MSKPELLIAPCTHEAAKYAVEHWHYSRTMPVGKSNLYGVWENNAFVGVVIFGRGANNNIHKPYNLQPNQICELTRIALTKHCNPVSRIMSVSFKALIKHNPKLRLIVSYADPEQKHNGAIYQATNWIYLGQTSADFYILDKFGQKHHSRVVSSSGYQKQFGVYKSVIRPCEGEKIITEGKHRYLYPLDRAMRKQIEPLAQPYPKR